MFQDVAVMCEEARYKAWIWGKQGDQVGRCAGTGRCPRTSCGAWKWHAWGIQFLEHISTCCTIWNAFHVAQGVQGMMHRQSQAVWVQPPPGGGPGDEGAQCWPSS
jgi:hypothetical protein